MEHAVDQERWRRSAVGHRQGRQKSGEFVRRTTSGGRTPSTHTVVGLSQLIPPPYRNRSMNIDVRTSGVLSPAKRMSSRIWLAQ